MSQTQGVVLEEKIKEVAERIIALREDMNLSQAALAKKIGLSLEEYKKLESGEEDFSFTFIYKIAQVCGVEITDIMEGESPALTECTVTRKGEGVPILRREGFTYNRLAAKFKNKLAEPFYVKIPYSQEALNPPYEYSTHVGQELDIVIKGSLKMVVGDVVEILHEGDCIYYNSAIPHNEIALGGEDCEIYAVVMNPDAKGPARVENKVQTFTATNVDLAQLQNPVYEKFIKTDVDEFGVVHSVKFMNDDNFNFAFDVVDEMGRKAPSKTAMIYVSDDKKARRFTFEEISRYSSMTANYFESLGIKKGDKVMLVLKRHYQFWFSILALHKIGAVAIPATHLLKDHDFDYRFKAGNVSAIVCTGTGDVAEQVDIAAAKCPGLKTKIMVNGEREGWHDFNNELNGFSDEYKRTDESAGGDDTMLMFFTSGTTGYPKIAAHSFKYPLGHFLTAKYWHNVDPNGLHFTIADTGWGKALWGKLYGQWLCEAATFVYDFEKFKAEDILPMFAKYRITTFCAPTTMYRFFIKEDLAKYDLSSIKYATVAGEAMNPEVYNQFVKATGVRIMEGFGQTETTLTVANFVGERNKVGSMGRPSPQYEVEILLADGTPAPIGETGEICIRTEDAVPNGLFKGYYMDEEKTKEAWHDGYYHTGDTAWKDEDGFFWYVGRVDDLIKSSGYRIGPFEIESVIMELPYVLECAVVAAPDEIRGQVVKANIVLTKGTVGSEELKKEIQTYVKVHTAPYKYPRIVEFMDELPKTISGKVRRVDLRNSK
ncbi:MAG: AMP-binding protein [Lachnospiraceae bacterium]|nr:AMP-binding protein [Lachnospiraceae bacterium]